MKQTNIHQQVTGLAWPMILSNLTVPLLGLVDTAILGHLPQAHYLGAVAIGAIIFDMLFWTFGFLRMGTTAMAAQAHGADNIPELQAILFRSLVLAGLFGLLLILLQAPLFDLAFWYMSPAPEVMHYARLYCDIRIYSAPAVLCDYVIVGWLLSLGKPRQILLIAVVTNLVNLILDYWLVVHMGMLTDGVAWGSFISSLVAMIMGLTMVYRAIAAIPTRFQFRSLLDPDGYLTLLKVNRFIFVRTLCLLFSFSFFYAQSAQQDTLTLSANSVIMTLLLTFAYGADGFANAAEVLSGRAIGARRLSDFYQVNSAIALWFLFASALFVAIIWWFDTGIIQLLTDITGVVATTLVYWPWLLVLPLVAAWNFMLDGVLLGAGKVRAMQNTMLVSSFLIFLPVWYFSKPLGNHGLWLSFCFFHAARSSSMALMYYYYSKTKTWF